MIITAAEFKENTEKYLSLTEKEDIIITKNREESLMVTDTETNRLNAACTLFGALRNDIEEKEIQSKRRTYK